MPRSPHEPTDPSGDGTSPDALSLPDEKRTSLLDIVRDTLSRSGKTTVLYRVVVCGKVVPGTSRNDIAAHYQKFFKQYQAADTAELITGLLVLMEEVWIHILEASSKVAYSFLRDLANPSSSHLTSSSKILLLQDDISTRFYPFWASRNNDEPAGAATEADLDDNVRDKGVADVCVGLCGVGGRLGALSKADLKPALDELGTHFKDLLPRAATLERMTESNAVMGIEEWLEMFDTHSNPVLESELVWPTQQTLVF
ncbi:hypothetical protein HKX48_006636 [Thoreauomyces humboldtii]|nr:hypothetical protein HKX48_006636 [Thoreauomyces humboldtii]